MSERTTECPECGGDIERREYNDGRCDRIELACEDCEWECEL